MTLRAVPQATGESSIRTATEAFLARGVAWRLRYSRLPKEAAVDRLERRSSLRVPATGHSRLPIGLRDVSLRGFAIETSGLLPPNTVQDFQLVYPDGEVLVLRARVAYSRREPGARGTSVWVTGAEYLAEVRTRRRQIAQPLAS